VRLVPLPEGRGVDLDDRALDKGVGPDELVVRGVVLDAYDARLLRAVLGAPSKVARVEPERTVLEVATADTNSVNALSTNLGAGGCEVDERARSAKVSDLLLGRGRPTNLARQERQRTLPSELELSLLAVEGTLRARSRTLVARVS
jgi:hypothetical protein